jgi:hypothetical protein
MTQPQPLTLKPLAQNADVLTALGFEGSDITVLPVTMQVRMPTVLSRVSRRFRMEAQRFFTPGTYTQMLNIHAGYTRLMEPPSRIDKVKLFGRAMVDWTAWQEGGPEWVTWAEGGPGAEDFGTDGMLVVLGLNEPPPPKTRPTPRWSVDGIWMQWTDWDFWQLNGKRLEVTYTWDTPVPPDVVSTVADIVARNLVVDPMGALRQSKLLMSRHFRQEVADWVSDGSVGFSKDDICEARSYRYPMPPAIIANITQIDASPSTAFLADTSW